MSVGPSCWAIKAFRGEKKKTLALFPQGQAAEYQSAPRLTPSQAAWPSDTQYRVPQERMVMALAWNLFLHLPKRPGPAQHTLLFISPRTQPTTASATAEKAPTVCQAPPQTLPSLVKSSSVGAWLGQGWCWLFGLSPTAHGDPERSAPLSVPFHFTDKKTEA